jgi:hypothetical protein
LPVEFTGSTASLLDSTEPLLCAGEESAAAGFAWLSAACTTPGTASAINARVFIELIAFLLLATPNW